MTDVRKAVAEQIGELVLLSIEQRAQIDALGAELSTLKTAIEASAAKTAADGTGETRP